MYKIIENMRLNRTRMQISLGFLLVLSVMVLVAGGLLYKSTASLFIQHSEGYLGEAAKQASARVDAVLSQIDSLSLQVVMDPQVQELLYRSKQGLQIPIEQKLTIRPVVDQLVALSWVVKGIDIYTVNEPLYPLENRNLSDILGNDPQTLSRLKEGQLVFVGNHPQDSQALLAVREIRLERSNLAVGGYVMIKVMKSMVDFFNEEFFTSIKGGSMHLYDHNNMLVATTMPSMLENRNLNVGNFYHSDSSYPLLKINGSDYLHIIEYSRGFNWSTHILVPIGTITEKVDVLKEQLLWALAVGTFVCIALLWIISRMVTRPIAHLRKIMRGVHSSLPATNEVTYFNYEMNELNDAYNKLVREIGQLIETVYEKERLKNQAEIKMLQAQIHPHFLFNTLEALYWTLQDKKETEGANIVFHLSKLFRYSIKSSEGDDWTDLHQEIEHCRRYLEIMKFRMCERLAWHIDIDPEVTQVRVPKLLIQPLVENAIQHGIEPKVAGGAITLLVRQTVRLDEDFLHIQVKDDGKGMNHDQAKQVLYRLEKVRSIYTMGSGIGLSNVKARMLLHYGQGCELQLSSVDGLGTEVNLYLPVKELKSNERNRVLADSRG